jgi:transposase InsO family protein
MDVNRSGYYKWKQRQINKPEWIKRREDNLKIIQEVHNHHKTHGYRWISAYLKQKYGLILKPNYVHVCCKYAGIKSQAPRIKWRKSKGEKLEYPNLVGRAWYTTRPYEIIVSDMTIFYYKGIHYELTLYLDTFNNEIVSYGLSSREGDPRTYYDGLKGVIKLIKKEQTDQVTILHTDQGSVYSSRSYNELLKHSNIKHSMSRVGTPTDNAIMESINGWIKEEMFYDFGLKHCNDINLFIKEYIHWFNHERPAYALQYKTPHQYKRDMGY